MTDTFLVVSDLDGTLLGDDAALERFAAWHDRNRDRILLVYSSGRLINSVRESLATSPLPAPVAIVGGVGTDIRWLPKFHSPPDWPRVRGPTWSRESVRMALTGIRGLAMQRKEFQSAWKVSYHYRRATTEQLAEIHRRVAEAGLSAEIVYSSQRDLDILPAGIHKGSAARFIARRLRISPRRLIVCGDSGNDASLLQIPAYGVIVGNAQDELKHCATPRTYLAETPFAAGVLEGLLYWLPRMMVETNIGHRVSFRRL